MLSSENYHPDDTIILTNARHKESKIMKPTDFHEFKIIKFMHNVHYNKDKLPSFFQKDLKTNENDRKYITRQSKDYKLFCANKAWGDKMIRKKGARLWNELPTSIKGTSNSYTFANKHHKRASLANTNMK